MTQFMLPGLALVWLLGTWIRIYRQARFFQIEEYMSQRYLAWVWRNRPHLLPMRPLAAWLIALILVALLTETQSSTLLYIIAIAAALIAALPPTETEIKKPLVLTGRMKRILAATFLLSSVVLAVAIFRNSYLSCLGFAGICHRLAQLLRHRAVLADAALADTRQPVTSAI